MRRKTMIVVAVKVILIFLTVSRVCFIISPLMLVCES